MALGNTPPPAGAFCLSGYYGLESVEKLILSELAKPPGRWDRIAVCYSGTQGGNVQQLLSVTNQDSPEDITCHFVVCNGFGGADGQIQPTEKWRRQCSIAQSGISDSGRQTIYVCVIADGKTARPTDLQIRRVEALIEALCREFNIQIEFVHCPNDWP
jgi:hypothetical protein